MVEVTDEVRRAAMEYLTEIIRIHHPDSKPVEAIRDDHPALLAFARIYQCGKLEGARLAIDAAERAASNSIASHCTEIGLGTYFRRGDQLQETSQWWKLQRVEALVREMRDLPGQSIRALSPAKIVGEG